MNKQIGVISDTHGLIRPEAIKALTGTELIIHAGDVGSREVLDKLEEIAPVVAVLGNTDGGELRWKLPETERIEFWGKHFYLLHDLNNLYINPVGAMISVVISGHTHKPKAYRRNGTLYLNPGSAGPRRDELPVSVARMRVGDGELDYEIIELPISD